jgi:anti-sigma factor RsiW
MTISHADSLLVQRFLDGELSPEAGAALRARLAAEPDLAAAVEAARALRVPFAAAKAAPGAPAGFAGRVVAAVRQLPSRAQLEGAEAAAVVLRVCRRVLVAAAVLFAVGLAMRSGWLELGLGAPLQAAPDEVQSELQRLDRLILERGERPDGATRR